MAKRKKKQYMGRIIFCLGILFKIIQIIGAAFSSEALSGTTLTLFTTCLLVGGLAVFAIEKICVTSIFAAVGAVCTLGAILPTQNTFFTLLFTVACFACFGSMLISMKKKSRIALGAVIVLLTVLLALHLWMGTFSIPAPLITVILIAIYALAGIGVFL